MVPNRLCNTPVDCGALESALSPLVFQGCLGASGLSNCSTQLSEVYFEAICHVRCNISPLNSTSHCKYQHHSVPCLFISFQPRLHVSFSSVVICLETEAISTFLCGNCMQYWSRGLCTLKNTMFYTELFTPVQCLFGSGQLFGLRCLQFSWEPLIPTTSHSIDSTLLFLSPQQYSCHGVAIRDYMQWQLAHWNELNLLFLEIAGSQSYVWL